MKKCYILGAVTGGSSGLDIFNVYKRALKDKLEILGTPIETSVFTGTAEERFVRAEAYVKSADIIIADMSAISTGAGIELGMAHLLKKDIYCFAKDGSKVSALVIGMLSSPVRYYDSEQNLYDMLRGNF